MEFEVESRGHFGMSSYKHMWVRQDNCTMTTGLLDLSEAEEIGKRMFDAAANLLSSDELKKYIREYFTEEDLFEEEE